jgi:hypothetical protein
VASNGGESDRAALETFLQRLAMILAHASMRAA